jgi:hypothetical protein
MTKKKTGKPKRRRRSKNKSGKYLPKQLASQDLSQG